MKLSRPVYRHEEIVAESGMVVAQHRDAARIGVEVLQKGGNAVDAAVTTAFATGVLLPIWNGIGGGGLMVVHLDGGGGGAIDFGMQAPGLCHPEMFELEDTLAVQGPSRRFSYRKVKDDANRDGYTSIAIPGTVAGLCAALEKWGSISLDQAVRPAVDIARNGFPLSRTAVLTLVGRYELLKRFEATRHIYLQDGAHVREARDFTEDVGSQVIVAHFGQLRPGAKRTCTPYIHCRNPDKGQRRRGPCSARGYPGPHQRGQ